MAAIQLVTEVPGPRSRALLSNWRTRRFSRGLATTHPLFIHSGKSATLTDVDRNTFLDFTGGIGAMNVGHARDEVVKAAVEQVGRFSHVAIQVNGYESYVALAEKLCQIVPIAGEKRALAYAQRGQRPSRTP